MKRATKAKPKKTAAKVDNMHACIGCGKHDTASKGRVCWYCLNQRVSRLAEDAKPIREDPWDFHHSWQEQDGDDENHNDTKEFA